MEFLVLLVIFVVAYIFLRLVFSVNIKEIKKLVDNKKLDELAGKYPSNVEICKDILKKLNNENVKIEEDINANTTMYLVMSNKILIANLKNSCTRIQTIAHECLHSIQDKKILWANFIFANIYLLYFFISSL